MSRFRALSGTTKHRNCLTKEATHWRNRKKEGNFILRHVRAAREFVRACTVYVLCICAIHSSSIVLLGMSAVMWEECTCVSYVSL